MADKRRYWNIITFQGYGVMWTTDKEFAATLYNRLIINEIVSPFVLITGYHVEFTPETFADNYRYIKYPNVDAYLSFKHVPPKVRDKFVVRFINIAKKWKITNQSGSGSSQSLPCGSE